MLVACLTAGPALVAALRPVRREGGHAAASRSGLAAPARSIRPA
jgi:hypothetical protein